MGKLALKLLGPLLKLIFPKLEEKFSDMRQEIIEHIFKVGKLEENTRYRELPNDADRKIEKLEEHVKMMAKDIHPPAIDLEEWKEVRKVIKKLQNKSSFKKLFK